METIKEILMDKRNEYYDQINTIIDGALGNGDITEEEAAELKAEF